VYMICKIKNKGSVFIVAIFVIAMLSTVVIGMLKINSGEIQLVYNQIFATQALAVADAGLNAALAEIRDDPLWNTGFVDEPVDPSPHFAGGQYTVDVNDSNIKVTASVNSWHSYAATVEVDITVGADDPHIIRIDSYRTNEPSGGG
jgi:hypothetical protein